MSTSNKSYREHTPKVNRYLHRIEQLIGNRGRTPSPINSKTKKPMKTQTLDYYLKYEFTFKILHNFFDKKDKVEMRHFFNNLRVFEQHKVQTIYRFVSIEKQQCPHLMVDAGIASKMMVFSLKMILKLRMKDCFDCIVEKSNKIKERKILYSSPPIIKTNSQVKQRNPAMGLAMKIILKSIFKRSKRQAFLELKNVEKKKSNDKSLILSLLKIFERRKRHAFEILLREKQKNAAEIKRMGYLLFQKAKKSLIISLFKSKQNKNYVYEGTNKVSIALISAIYQRKITFINCLKKFYYIPFHQKSYSAHKFLFLLQKQIFKRVLTSFHQLKGEKDDENCNKNIQNTIKKFVSFLSKKSNSCKYAFEKILQFSHSQEGLLTAFYHLEKAVKIINMRYKYHGFEKIKQNKAEKKRNSLVVIENLFSKQIIAAFVKIKVLKDRKRRNEEENMWMEETKAFLEERENFQSKIYEGWKKLEENFDRPFDLQENSSFKIALTPTFKQKNHLKKIP